LWKPLASNDILPYRFKSEGVMPSRNVFLSDQFETFITSGIEEGRYSNASEVVREGLRLLQQRDAEDRARIEWLRGAVQEGIDAMERGDYVTLNSPQEIKDHIRGLRNAHRNIR
jgi:antitoxin ParD1/3/4